RRHDRGRLRLPRARGAGRIRQAPPCPRSRHARATPADSHRPHPARVCRGHGQGNVPGPCLLRRQDGLPLAPVDDLAPVTVITYLRSLPDGSVLVRGSTADNGTVTKVLVNGHPARPLAANFLEWEAMLDGVQLAGLKVSAHAEDAAGNVEKQPHVVEYTPH